MSGKSAVPPQTPLSPRSSISPYNTRSPRESISIASSSIHAPPEPDRDHLAQALDKIHTSAAQKDVLTTFNDLEPPPSNVSDVENKGLAGDLVQSGLTGLSKYFRFKPDASAAPSPARDKDRPSPRPLPLDGLDPESYDAASRKSSSTAATSARASLSGVPRVDTGATVPTLGSTTADGPSAIASSQTLDHPTHGSQAKATSQTTLATTSTSKSGSSSRQSIPSLGSKPTSAVAPVTVSAFKDGPWGVVAGADDVQGRSAKKGPSAFNDGQLPYAASDAAVGRKASDQNPPPYDRPSAGGSAKRPKAPSMDGSAEWSISSSKGSADPSSSSLAKPTPADLSMLPPAAKPSSKNAAKRPAVINRISRHESQTRGSNSRSSSMSQGTAEPSTISTSAHNTVHHDSFGHMAKPQRARSGAYRIPGTTTDEGAPEIVNAKLESMRKQVLSKDFWMADETCNECFLCAVPFSAFRRKHHCRTCGCIFDSRCTSIISGQKFGVPGTLRVCKPCLDVISQRDDGNMSDDDSADDSFLPAIFRPSQPKSSRLRVPRSDRDDASISERADDVDDDTRSLSTPMMAIPATRRMGDASNRSSAVLEIDTHQLSRPSSSRSLKSVASTRPQSSGHRRQHSKQSLLGRFKSTPDDRAPFRKSANDELAKKPGLPAFHDDNVIDPELAPYLSDQSSGDEQQMGIFETMTGDDQQTPVIENDRANFGSYVGGGRKSKMRSQAEKSVSGFSFASKGGEELSTPAMHPRMGSRRRNMSIASAHHLRSPRPKSAVFKGPTGSTETLPVFDSPAGSLPPKLTRSSSMKGDKEPRLELNPASLLHVRRLLQQLLQDAEVPNVASWENALVPILLKCTTSVDPDIARGDDMDIRHYVKLKKIPGGRPSDTSYVSGVIFTKNLALKSMPRRINGPRVVIVSFPIEYQRHQQQFMSLHSVIEQEKEYLARMVQRIASLLRPQLVLAEKGVSGYALQLFSEYGISVAYNVKPSVLSAVSRCLETEIVSSMDMLSLPRPDFQTGKSAGFEVKTFVNDEIKGRKKTYIFLTGNQDDLGCTIALRGASSEILARLKRITEFMVYVVYNLKLESCLMRDSFIQLPTSETLPSTQRSDEDSLGSIRADASDPRQRTMSTLTLDEAPPSQASYGSEGPPSGADLVSPELALSRTIEHTNRLISLHETHARDSSDSVLPEDIPMPTYYSDTVAKYDTRILSASPFVKFAQPYLLMKARELERRLMHLKRLRDQDIVEEQVDGEKPKPQKFQLIKPTMVHQTGHKAPRQIMEILHAVHDAEYDKALYHYQTQTRQWENYIQGNLDLFEPYAHQNIVVLHSQICTETKIPCLEPSLFAFAFYDEHTEHTNGMDPDCPLGQYIEDICYGADSICGTNSCDRKMEEHHRTYVHGEARITVFIEPEKSRPARENITMWSYCKLCKRETSEMEMSRGAWKYSFGKYLELSFWSRGTRLVKDEDEDGWVCPHDHHRDHIRYFGFLDKIVRVHYDPIDLLEIIVPRVRITWKVEHDLNMKNDIFTHSQERWTRFTASVKTRLKGIKLDTILPEKADACKTELERLNKKIQDDHTALIKKLQETYMSSKYYEVIPFNVVLREILERVTEWDAIFTRFEADFLPTDKDIRKMTMVHLRKLFTDESKESLSSAEGTIDFLDGNEKSTQASSADGDTRPESRATEAAPITPQLEAISEKGPLDLPQEQILPDNQAMPESVEHLDLATPKSAVVPPTPSTAQAETVPSTPKTPSYLETAPPTLGAPLSPVPDASPSHGQASVTEQVEELRRRQHATVLKEAEAATAAAGKGNSSVTSIPTATNPERGPSRRAGLAVSPPMVRAISHPVNTPTLPRPSPSTGKKGLGASRDKGRVTPTIDDHPGADARKTPTGESSRGEKKLFSGLKASRKGGQSAIPRFVGKRDSRVSTIRKHFEQLSREFEKEREKDRKKRADKITHYRPFLQKSSTKAVVEVYENVDEAVKEPGPIEEDSGATKGAEPNPAPGTRPATQTGVTAEDSAQVPSSAVPRAEETTTEAETDDLTQNTSLNPTDDEQGESDTEPSLLEGTTLEEIAESLDSSTEIPLELPKHDRLNFMKVLTNFWNERSAGEWPPLDYPLNLTDHIFIDSDIIVREDEPSSLIAFALTTEHYKDVFRKFHRRKLGDDGSSPAEASEQPDSDLEDADGPISEERLENSLVHTTSSHYKYQFSKGSARMLVKVFFAEQFDAIRRKCGVADRIVESLSRCLKWDSKGGKTKSVFLKTQDDRLVMKSLSPVETAAFLRFAPAYFRIMAEALFHDLPSVIAKMLGFFQVIIKNPLTNTEIKLDLLLMENLFYDRSPSRIFDLKGSMRNRKIQSTGEQNEVLLDENMVEYIYESPLFAREHSKKLLRASVWNDTLFLARQNVMDYSLMIAVDESRRELVVGIIDCIRTYTWDKKLESWIKDRGFGGGGRNRPTVTSPKEYKSRFREAMARYILQAPNCWHQFNVPQLASKPRAEVHLAGDDGPVAEHGVLA